MKVLHGILIAGLTGVLAFPAFASQSAAPVKSDTTQTHGKWADLGLNQTQKDQMKALRTENKEAMKPQFESSKAIHKKIKEEFLKPNPDPGVIDSYTEQLSQIQKQMMKNRFSGLFKIKQILTPDQFQKFLTMEQTWRKDFHNKKRNHSDEN